MNDPNEGIETIVSQKIKGMSSIIIEMNDPNEGIETLEYCL